MQSAHTPFWASPMMGLIHSHTKLLHLGPLPIPSCHTLSPFLTLSLASMYPSSYHNDEDDWFPNLCSVINAASISLSPSFSPFPISRITGLPDAGRQKCCTTLLKFGTYISDDLLRYFFLIMERAYSMISVYGRSFDPSMVMFDRRVSPATCTWKVLLMMISRTHSVCYIVREIYRTNKLNWSVKFFFFSFFFLGVTCNKSLLRVTPVNPSESSSLNAE